jgi:hypothetical protein
MEKLFREQFSECSKLGLNKEDGEFLSFEEHPELLPLLPNSLMRDDISSGAWRGIPTKKCGKFGGICSGGNKDCKKLRGYVNV